MSLIKCESLTLAYENRDVVSDVSFTLEAGDYLCIIGENGSGKSTLVRALLGLKKPKSGSIVFDADKHGGVGYLPQQTLVQRDFPASVWEVVISGTLGRAGLKPYYTNVEKETARRALERLGIANLSKRCYRELSGGQQQRTLLARALCATSSLLLLDEPAAGLDPEASASMYSLISELNKKDGITIIMVSHDIPSALEYSSKILKLDHSGTFFGTTEEYKAGKAGHNA